MLEELGQPYQSVMLPFPPWALHRSLHFGEATLTFPQAMAVPF
jgi:hypothetical protein